MEMELNRHEQALEALHDSEERYRALFSAIPVAVFVCDRDAVIQHYNRRAVEFWGREPQCGVEKHCGSLKLILPDGNVLPHTQSPIVDVLRTGKPASNVEVFIERPDGSRLPVIVNFGALKNSRGEIVGAVTSFDDISKRKEAEETVRKLNAELEQRVAQQTAELVNAIAERETLNEQLLHAQKMESVGLLASGVAHDFNNILNLILGYSALLEQNPSDLSTIVQSVEVIKESVKRGSSLVQQLLAIGRKSESQLDFVDVNGMIRSLEPLLKKTFDRTIDISLSLAAGLPPIRADRNQINQVLLNLCVNARDAMPDGGQLAIATGITPGSELRERFYTAREARYEWIRISDTGNGIDEPVRQRIFEPFFTTKDTGKGTGLGLFVAYGIVTRHGGFIDLSGGPGHGTIFEIYLPVPKEAGAVPTEPSKQAEIQRPAGNGETLLFVDDESHLVALMRKVLARAGYRVLTAHDGIEAVEIYRAHHRDIALVILDLGLPRLNGWEAFQQIKQANSKVKVILASGYLSEQAEAALQRRELSGVVMKPYEMDDVLAKVSAAMQ